MFARGEATVAQVDHALMHGIGPRLAAVGLFGGYILNVEDRDPATWLRHIAAFDFGAELVHDAPFPEWTQALEAEVVLGREASRERVCQYVYIWVVDV